MTQVTPHFLHGHRIASYLPLHLNMDSILVGIALVHTKHTNIDNTATIILLEVSPNSDRK